MPEGSWSKTEKQIARAAFDKALENERSAVLREVHSMLNAAKDSRVIWRLCDYLDQRRREIDSKYEYSYSMLTILFARLIREGWLVEEDLAGLREDKLASIKSILHM